MLIKKTLVVLFLVGAGCSTKSVSEVETSKIYATITATAKGDGMTNVAVSLNETNSILKFLQLTSDDKLSATFNGETRTLDESSLLGAVSYSTVFNYDNEGTEVHVAFYRKFDNGAPDSSAKLPIAFKLSALASSTYSRSQPIEITWDSVSSDPMSLEVSGECIDTYNNKIASNTSSIIVPALALKKKVAEGTTDQCTAKIAVSRTRIGKLDPAFANGVISGVQLREVTFNSTP